MAAPSLPLINLMRGWPSRALLPIAQFKEAANAVLSDVDVAGVALEYGPDEGYEPCRKAIADWLTAFYRPGSAITPARICISGGASQNLGRMLSVYTDPEYTRNIWIVAPAYYLAFRIFEDAGFAGKMRTVPEDEHGLDIEYLRREMQQSEDRAQSKGNTTPRYKPERARAKVYKHIIYCVPTFSNPSSKTMSLERRQQLVRLAREFDALVTPDDVYDLLQWPADPDSNSRMNESTAQTAHMPRLVDVDRTLDGGAEREGADGFGNACSNGSFSKLVGPGARVGWVEGSDKFAYGVSQCGTSCSGGAPCHLTSVYITHLLKTNQVQRHIATVLRPAYASRYRTMMKAIQDHLIPLGFRLPQPNRDVVGGYFVWLTLPDPLTAHKLAKRCQEEEHVAVAPGGLFAVPGNDQWRFAHNIRLCFAYEDEAKLGEGVRRIAQAATRLLQAEDDGKTDGYVLVDGDDEDRTATAFK